MKQAATLHLVRVFLESAFPVRRAITFAACQIIQDATDFVVLGDLPQTYIGNVRERNHYGHAAVKESKKIELFELGTESAGTNIFDRPNALVGINYFFTDHEGHDRDLP